MAEERGSADLVRGYTNLFSHLSSTGQCITNVRTEPPRCACGEIKLRYVEGEEARADG